MGHLTDHTPKPLLPLHGKYLIEYAIQALLTCNITEIVINISYLKEKIKATLGNGNQYGVQIQYSEEEAALETGGGIVKALPMLGDDPFLVLSADVISDYPLQNLPKNPDGLAHIVLVDNPHFHAQGDFALKGQQVFLDSTNPFTYSNIGVYRKELFTGCSAVKFPLGNLLRKAVRENRVTGEHFQGAWYNLGTEEQLQKLQKQSF
jgi:MurNAc alpha-1-phosphate uridylyltransferase